MSGEEHKWNKQKQSKINEWKQSKIRIPQKEKSNLSYGEDFPLLIIWNTNRGFWLSIFILSSGTLSKIPF